MPVSSERTLKCHSKSDRISPALMSGSARILAPSLASFSSRLRFFSAWSSARTSLAALRISFLASGVSLPAASRGSASRMAFCSAAGARRSRRRSRPRRLPCSTASCSSGVPFSCTVARCTLRRPTFIISAASGCDTIACGSAARAQRRNPASLRQLAQLRGMLVVAEPQSRKPAATIARWLSVRCRRFRFFEITQAALRGRCR
jgi:hypothetical protein